MNYKVSIIIPVYGVEDYVGKCIDSIINQTLREIQIIVVDDCSPDKSISILEDKINNSFRKNDTIIIRKPENEGLAFARKTGMEYAKGEYIIHLDSDDYYCSNDVLERLYNKAIEGNYDIVEGDFIVEYPNGIKKIIKQNINIKSNVEYINLLLSNNIEGFIFTILIKKSVYNNFIVYDNKITFREDVVHKIQVSFYSKNIYYYDIPIINYVQRKDSLTNIKKQYVSNIVQLLKGLELVESFLKEKNIYDQEIINIYKLLIRVYILNKSIFSNDVDKSIYRDYYKELQKEIFTNRYIRLKERIRFFIYFYMFSLLKYLLPKYKKSRNEL